MIRIICVGKLKEIYLKELVTDYYERIMKYYKIDIIELKDSDITSEGIEIQKHLNNNSYKIVLDINGQKVNSLEFENIIENSFNNGSGNITFIIGGSDGVHEDIKKLANKLISFGNITYPHGLFRGILLEQIYRAFKIMNNETYHK